MAGMDSLGSSTCDAMAAEMSHVQLDPAAHVVQFYAHDDELTAGVSAFLLDALRHDGVAIVVATPIHSLSFAAALEDAGVDVAPAQANGTFIMLDAQHTMGSFLIGDKPDSAAFEAVIGSVVRRATAAGRPVHVFGEMVALMWDAGQINAALEVEEMWNELGRRLPFSLYCAYSAQSTSGDLARDAFLDVCHLHTSVVGSSHLAPELDPGREVARTFAGVPTSPRSARNFVIETLQHWGDDALTDDAALIVTELATNAVVHTSSDFTVEISSSSPGLRIAVRDASLAPATRRDSTPGATSGRGLAMVAAVSRRWSCEPEENGKVVWAELRR